MKHDDFFLILSLKYKAFSGGDGLIVKVVFYMSIRTWVWISVPMWKQCTRANPLQVGGDMEPGGFVELVGQTLESVSSRFSKRSFFNSWIVMLIGFLSLASDATREKMSWQTSLIIWLILSFCFILFNLPWSLYVGVFCIFNH